MKITRSAALFLGSALFFTTSCESTQQTIALQDESVIQAELRKEFPDLKGPGAGGNTAEETKEEEKEQTPAEIFAEKVKDITLRIVSEPGETTKGKDFAKSFKVKATDNEQKPVPDFDITVSYPASIENGELKYEEKQLKTGEDGTVDFTLPTPDFSTNAQVKFYPTADTSDPEISALAEEKTTKASYKVQTNLKNAGGVIAVVDFNQNGKPITTNPVSSSNLLMSLMKLGFTRIGNIDLTDSVLKDDVLQLQKNAKAMVGNTAAFLIFGTVKYETPIEKTEAGFTCNLVAEIKCLDLKTGKLMYTSAKKVSETDKNEWNALANARKTISELYAQELKYGI